MKTLFLALGLFLSTILSAQSVKTITLSVAGNCGECKERIENAADIKGVKICTWDSKTKVAKITYDPSKTTPEAIELAIAAAGHDTAGKKATADAYKKLPNCCRYRDGKCEK